VRWVVSCRMAVLDQSTAGMATVEMDDFKLQHGVSTVITGSDILTWHILVFAVTVSGLCAGSLSWRNSAEVSVFERL
jgi:hypothetical protein